MLQLKRQCNCTVIGGFTLLELVTVLSIIAIMFAITTPACMRYYHNCCLKEAVFDIVQMVKEGKTRALDGELHAIYFDSVGGTATLLAGKGPDEKWNTADDIVVRTIRLKDKGGALKFGCENCASIPLHVKPEDGISFMGNIAIFNQELTGLCSGGIYISSTSGAAMAMLMNSTDAGYELWNWSNGKWVRL